MSASVPRSTGLFLRSWPGSTERGAGVVGTSTGFLIFLLLLFAAVQILFNLYATSMVVSEAHRAARSVASIRGGPHRCQHSAPVAEQRFQEALGSYGDAGYARLQWNCDNPGFVEVTVTAEHPSLLPARIGRLRNLNLVERTIQVRVEQFQP